MSFESKLGFDGELERAKKRLDEGSAMVVVGMTLRRPEGHDGPLVHEHPDGTVECHFVASPAGDCFFLRSLFWGEGRGIVYVAPAPQTVEQKEAESA